MSNGLYRVIDILLGKENEKAVNIGLLIFRLVTGIFIMTHGLQKLSNFETLKNTFADPIGLGSQLSLILILFAEVGCSLLIIFGAFTRLAVIPLIIGMAVVTFVVHGADPFSGKEISLLYLAMFVVLGFTGPGKYSVNFLLRRWLHNIKPLQTSPKGRL